ncbi:MAG: acetoin utilization protein AcuC [Hyphomicrobiaceae bacterium]
MTFPLNPVFIGSDRYREAAFGQNHPLAISRVETVYDLCTMLGWLPDASFLQSPVASFDELTRFHCPAYADALRDVSASGTVSPLQRQRYHFCTMENPVFPGLFERASTSVGGSIRAARYAAEGRVAYHPSGGTHHGRPDRASGFCYFNDPVFAILTLLDQGISPVAYVDLDAHHGDGVQDAFADDDRVWTVSTHEEDRWPHTGLRVDHGGGRSLNLPVPAGLNDTELQFLMQEEILPFLETVVPKAIVITMGADALQGDPLTRLELSNCALCNAVMTLISAYPSAVVLGGGGYNPWTLARCWTAMWGMIAGKAMPDRLPDAARRLLGGLDCDLVDEEDVLPEWTTTLLDPPNEGDIRDSVRALAEFAPVTGAD